jgi:hypothetical protein
MEMPIPASMPLISDEMTCTIPDSPRMALPDKAVSGQVENEIAVDSSCSGRNETDM